MNTATRRLRALLSAILPAWMVEGHRHAALREERAHSARQSLRDVFERVYAQNRWGGHPGEFCSGSGSDASYATRYREIVSALLTETGATRVVDLGCGDFRVGRLLVELGIDYTGVDVVGPLIERNTREFAREGLRFLRLDIAEDPLPQGEVCLIRQVLQHLSNAEVAVILEKAVRQYRYIVVTEHMPAPGPWVQRNEDKPHGPDTRISDASGLFLDAKPFDLEVHAILLRQDIPHPLKRPGEQLVTFLLRGHEA